MKPGEVATWLKYGPVLLLERAEIPVPCTQNQLSEFLADPENWPCEYGWKIKVLSTGEIVDVHEETLNTDDNFTTVGILE